MKLQQLQLGFLASNNGTGMRAVLAAIQRGALRAQAKLLVSNRRDAPAMDVAAQHGVPTLFLPTISDPAAADAKLAAALESAGVELIVLSGYLRKLGPCTLAAYANRILNMHPALLPKYGGQGMYGRRVHEAVAASADAVSGASAHLVDADYDRGPVIASREIALSPGDDAAAIEAKVTAIESALLVETLRRISEGTLRLP